MYINHLIPKGSRWLSCNPSQGSQVDGGILGMADIAPMEMFDLDTLWLGSGFS